MKKKVAFIAGHMRGGSTLLSMLLGQQEGYFAAGELNRLWRGGFLNNELCTCGKPFRSCDFWNAVVQDAFGGWEGITPEEMENLSKTIYPATKFPQLAIPSLRSTELQEKINFVTDVWEKLYSAILKTSGDRIVVDSTKVSLYGVLLAQIPTIDLYVLHLNRHSCGVAYSKQKKRVLPEIYWQTQYMTQHTLLHTAYKWIMRNLSASSLRLVAPHYLYIQYEKLASKPTTLLSKLAKFLDEPLSDLSFFKGKNKVVFSNRHMFGGNPMRFQDQEKQIQLDNEWRLKMPFQKKAGMLLLTWPSLLAYGYRPQNRTKETNLK